MGDHKAIQPATAEEVRQLGETVNRSFSTLATVFNAAALVQPSPVIKPSPALLTNGEGTLYRYQTIPQASFPVIPGSQFIPPFSSLKVRFTATAQPVRSVTESDPLPLAGVSIPSLGRATGAWRRALKQWSEVDPQTGYALKDWPTKWYTGVMRTKTSSLRSQRQLLFEEYER